MIEVLGLALGQASGLAQYLKNIKFQKLIGK